jgi:hypothetical protein
MPPTSIHPQKRPVLPPCPSFLKKCVFIAQGDFAPAFQGTMGGGKGKKMLENEKYSKHYTTHECNII